MSLARRFEPEAASAISTARDAARLTNHGELNPYGCTRPVRWLLDPVSDVSAEVRAALIGEVDLSPLGALIAILNFNALNFVACLVTRAPVFFWLLAANLVICTVRFGSLLLVRQHGSSKQPCRTDLYVVLTILWAVFESAMAGRTILTGNTTLELYGLALALAPQALMATRNLPAPRFASAIIISQSSPFMVWMFIAPDHWMFVLAMASPAYIYAIILTIKRFQTLMIENYVAQFANRHLASHDALTGILNRRGMHDALAREVEGRTCFALFAMDLDGFKAVNDTYGHLAGDLLLQMVTVRLHGVARKEDALARLGGDEFALLAPGLPDAAAETMASRLVAAVSQDPYTLSDGVVVRVGMSVGYAFAPDDGVSMQVLSERADAALYAVKQRGKGSWQRAVC